MGHSFIIIDENELDCFIARKIIGVTGNNHLLKAFINPEMAFDFIQNTEINESTALTIILLDLIMPFMDGFEFLNKFDVLPAELRAYFAICVLSSTKNSRDIMRLKAHASVKCILEKPLTKDKLRHLMNILNFLN